MATKPDFYGNNPIGPSKGGVLSQQDIDDLLKAISAPPGGKMAGGSYGNPSSQIFLDEPEEESDTRKIKIYDFARPDMFSRDSIRVYQEIHEEVIREFSQSLHRRKLDINFHIAQIDTCTFEEFNRSIPEPTIIVQYLMNDLPFYLQFDPTIDYVIKNQNHINIMLGKDYPPELTDLGKAESTPLFELFAKFLNQYWTEYTYTNIVLGNIYTTVLDFKNQVPRNDTGILISFETQYKDYDGLSALFFPWSTVRKYRERLVSLTKLKSQFSGNIVPFNKMSTVEMDLKFRLFSAPVKLCEVVEKCKDIRFKKVDIIINNRIIGIGRLINNKVEFIEKCDEGVETIMEKVNIQDNLNNVEVQLSVELGRTRRSVKDILQLGEGSILELDKDAGEPVDIYVNNVLFAKGEVVTIESDFGVRVVEIMAKH